MSPLSDLPAELLQTVREISSLLISEETLTTALDRVASLSAEIVPGAEAVGVTLIKDEKIQKRTYTAETAAYSDPRVLPIDQAQFTSNEGPCLQAIKDNQIFTIDDLATEERWPLFKEGAFEAGLRSSLSLPLAVGNRSIGALNMYAFSAHSFNDNDVEFAKVFASQAAVSLANVQSYQGAVELSANLSEAMKSRAVIEQAKGMIMLQRRCSPDDAFQTLVAASQARNKKLRDIAQEVVEAATTADSDGTLSGP